MNLKRSPFSILDKDKREMDYMKKEPLKKGIPLNWDKPEEINKWI